MMSEGPISRDIAPRVSAQQFPTAADPLTTRRLLAGFGTSEALVRLWPQTDRLKPTRSEPQFLSPNDCIGTTQEIGRKRESEQRGSCLIDDELRAIGKLERHLRGIVSPQDAIDEGRE